MGHVPDLCVIPVSTPILLAPRAITAPAYSVLPSVNVAMKNTVLIVPLSIRALLVVNSHVRLVCHSLWLSRNVPLVWKPWLY